MFLIGTGSCIEVFLASSIVSNSLPIIASFADNTATTFTPGAQQTTVSGITPVIVVSGAAASTDRIINFINIFNADVSAVTASFQISGSTTNVLTKTILEPSSTMQFTPETGWTIFDRVGNELVGSLRANFSPTIMTIPYRTTFGVGRATGNARSSTGLAAFVGTADKNFSSCSVYFRMSSAPTAQVEYAEIALLTGEHTIDQTPTLTPRGYADITAQMTGVAADLVSGTFSIANVNQGDALYIGIVVSGSLFGTYPQVRATNLSDFTEGIQYITVNTTTTRWSELLHKQVMFNIDGSNIFYVAASFA